MCLRGTRVLNKDVYIPDDFGLDIINANLD